MRWLSGTQRSQATPCRCVLGGHFGCTPSDRPGVEEQRPGTRPGCAQGCPNQGARAIRRSKKGTPSQRLLHSEAFPSAWPYTLGTAGSLWVGRRVVRIYWSSCAKSLELTSQAQKRVVNCERPLEIRAIPPYRGTSSFVAVKTKSSITFLLLTRSAYALNKFFKREPVYCYILLYLLSTGHKFI